jgi:hypothetical protein
MTELDQEIQVSIDVVKMVDSNRKGIQLRDANGSLELKQEWGQYLKQAVSWKQLEPFSCEQLSLHPSGQYSGIHD